MAQFTLGGGGMGMPPGMAQLLQEKYRQSNVQVNAQANEANARANFAAQQAKQVAPLAQSQIGLETTAGKLNTQNAFKAGEEGKWIGPRSIAEINERNAAASLNTVQAKYLPLRVTSDAAQSVGAANYSTAAAEAITRAGRAKGLEPLPAFSPMLKPAPIVTAVDAPDVIMSSPLAPTAAPLAPKRGTPSLLESPSFLGMSKPKFDNDPFGFKFKRGVTSVPGKGSGDKVPAALEPKEAVLNKHAADMLGRKKIAQLNKAGNEKRAKQDTQRVSKLAQALKQMGMV